MKMFKIGLVGLVSAMLALVVAGCSGGNSAEDAQAAFAGSWDLVEIGGSDAASAEDIELIKSLGLTVGLQLDDDGTGTLDLFGEELSGQWEATSTTQATITLEDQAVDMVIADGKLSLTQDGEELVFQKLDGQAATDASSSDAGADEQASSEPATDEAAADEAASSEAASSEAA